MDRSLDEIIGEQPRGSRRAPPTGPRGNRAPPSGPGTRYDRREEYPRDGVRKNRREERVNVDSDWVHDRYEDDRYDRRRAPAAFDDRYAGGTSRPAETQGTKLRIDNLHYEITEDDLRGLLSRKGPLISLHLQYDRSDRSTGTAFATYSDPRDARDAVEDFDGQHAHGQPIRVAIVPTGPRGGGDSYSGGGGRDGGAAPSAGRSLFDRMEKPSRSMFERMEQPRDSRRRDRSDSPRKPATAGGLNVDRYVPGGRDSRSPIRRRGTPREPGRRPGARREDSSRGGGAAGRGGRREGGPRPKKTQEELDREMEDYWGSTTMEGNGEGANGGGDKAGAEDDTDMIL